MKTQFCGCCQTISNGFSREMQQICGDSERRRGMVRLLLLKRIHVKWCAILLPLFFGRWKFYLNYTECLFYVWWLFAAQNSEEQKKSATAFVIVSFQFSSCSLCIGIGIGIGERFIRRTLFAFARSLDGFVMCEWWWWSCVMSLCIVMRDETGWFICVKEHTGCENVKMELAEFGCDEFCFSFFYFAFVLFCFRLDFFSTDLYILRCCCLPFVNRLRPDIVWMACDFEIV